MARNYETAHWRTLLTAIGDDSVTPDMVHNAFQQDLGPRIASMKDLGNTEQLHWIANHYRALLGTDKGGKPLSLRADWANRKNDRNTLCLMAGVLNLPVIPEFVALGLKRRLEAEFGWSQRLSVSGAKLAVTDMYNKHAHSVYQKEAKGHLGKRTDLDYVRVNRLIETELRDTTAAQNSSEGEIRSAARHERIDNDKVLWLADRGFTGPPTPEDIAKLRLDDVRFHYPDVHARTQALLDGRYITHQALIAAMSEAPDVSTLIEFLEDAKEIPWIVMVWAQDFILAVERIIPIGDEDLEAMLVRVFKFFLWEHVKGLPEYAVDAKPPTTPEGIATT